MGRPDPGPTLGWRLKAAVSTAFGRMGLDIRWRRPPADLRGAVAHPADAARLAPGSSFIMDVPVERLRLTRFFSAVREAGHPVVEMAHRIAAGADRAGALLPVETFYERWQPANRAEFFGLAGASPALTALPAWVPVCPWTQADAISLSRKMVAINRAENRLFGPPVGIRDGHITAGGPWSPAKADIEFRRIAALVASIRARGFVAEGLPTGLLIRAGEQWAVCMLAGQHRAAVAEAAGLRTLPVLFELHTPPVRRSEVRFWPLVRSGVFTAEQALLILDRVVAGEPPPGCPHPASPDRLGWQAERGNVSGPGS